MDDIIIIFFVVMPTAMFLSGLIIARQLRRFENVIFAKVFVKWRLLHSLVMGLSVSMPVVIFLYLGEGSSPIDIFYTIGLCILAAVGYYFGVALGWGHSQDLTENIAPMNQIQPSQLTENIIVDDTLTSVKIIINTKKRWGWFVLLAGQWVIMSLCIFPVVGLGTISIIQNYLPKNMNFLLWIFVGGLFLYLLYIKAQEIFEYACDKEIIDIDNHYVRITDYGLGLKRSRVFPAENIKRISTMPYIGVLNPAIRRMPFTNSNLPGFMLWHTRGLRRYRTFGRVVDHSSAQSILRTIYSKFPQYAGQV
jgi:hypothetical protein